MKILITGATGFFGSHLTEMCVEKGYKVAAFDRYNPNYNLGWLENYKHKKEIDFMENEKVFLPLCGLMKNIKNPETKVQLKQWYSQCENSPNK